MSERGKVGVRQVRAGEARQRLLRSAVRLFARRPYETVEHNGKLWRAVERFSDDNAVGWVFDPYLSCEEDGHA